MGPSPRETLIPALAWPGLALHPSPRPHGVDSIAQALAPPPPSTLLIYFLSNWIQPTGGGNAPLHVSPHPRTGHLNPRILGPGGGPGSGSEPLFLRTPPLCLPPMHTQAHWGPPALLHSSHTHSRSQGPNHRAALVRPAGMLACSCSPEEGSGITPAPS